MKISLFLIGFCVYSFFLSALSAEPLEYVAVATFDGKNITRNESLELTEFFRRKYNDAATYDLMEKSKIDAILKDREFKKISIVSDLSYALAMGRILSVQCIILGAIEKSDKGSSCSIKVFDLETQKRIRDITKSKNVLPKKLLAAIIPDLAKVIDPVLKKSAKKRIALAQAAQEKQLSDDTARKKETIKVDKKDDKSVAVKTKTKKKRERKRSRANKAPKDKVAKAAPETKEQKIVTGQKKREEKKPKALALKQEKAEKKPKRKMGKAKKGLPSEKKKAAEPGVPEQVKVAAAKKPEKEKTITRERRSRKRKEDKTHHLGKKSIVEADTVQDTTASESPGINWESTIADYNLKKTQPIMKEKKEDSIEKKPAPVAIKTPEKPGKEKEVATVKPEKREKVKKKKPKKEKITQKKKEEKKAVATAPKEKKAEKKEKRLKEKDVKEKKPAEEKIAAKKTTEKEKKVTRKRDTKKKAPEPKAEKEKIALRKTKQESHKEKEKRKGGAIVSAVTGIGVAVAIPVYMVLSSKNRNEESIPETFSLTIEW